MALTPGEHDRLLLHLQGQLARERRARGLLLNVPEATALIADSVCEMARDGVDLTTARERARTLLGPEDVLPGVIETVTEVRVEARFDDGTRLVVVHRPFGDAADEVARDVTRDVTRDPGNDGSAADDSADHPVAVGALDIANEAPTAIGLTSHVHLAEVNPRLRLDRAAAFGMRLAIPTGDTVWLHPGESRRLPFTPIGGARVQVGTSGVVDGPLDDPQVRARALATLRACGYLDVVDGTPLGTIEQAEAAVAALVRTRSVGKAP
jgi:urease subunit gamma/beta